MDKLEDLLAQTLAVNAERAPGDAKIVERVLTRPRRSRWGSWLSVAAAVAALVVVGAVLGVVHRSDSDISAQPAGWQAASFRGVQLYVPGGWTLGDQQCGVGLSSTVIRFDPDHGTQYCFYPEKASDTVVSLAAFSEVPQQLSPTHRRYPFRNEQWSGRVDGHGEDVLRITDLGVQVSVSSPDQQLALKILDTVRLVDVDAFGCASTMPSVVASGGSKGALVGGSPSSVTTCVYAHDGRLFGGGRVPRDQVAAYVALLGQLITSGSESECPSASQQAPVAQARLGYADGHTATLVATGACINNGARQWVSARAEDLLEIPAYTGSSSVTSRLEQIRQADGSSASAASISSREIPSR